MTHSDNSSGTQSGSLSDTARKAAEDLKETGRDALQGAKSVMGSTMTDLKAGAAAKADEMRETIATEGQRMADSLREAAGQQTGSVQGRVLETMASGVTAVSDSIRARDVSTLMSDVQSFARRNPALFVAGAAAAGLLLARLAAQAGRPQVGDLGNYGRSGTQAGDMGAGLARGGMGGRYGTSGETADSAASSGMINDPVGAGGRDPSTGGHL